ncbi:hypothetical protein Tco_0842421 [Tanacetum coccineum]|uniref:Uncharacterized protein n=1 Tax=Tanacetum coccineum TaxID=301880 RepID=A0ABQ5B4V7_9ASTR
MLWEETFTSITNVDPCRAPDMGNFTQGIQHFFLTLKASQQRASLKNPKKKVTPLLIPYGRFSKVIIYYLASNNNIHRRPDSAVHHTGDDYILGNLKLSRKVSQLKCLEWQYPRTPGLPEAIQTILYYQVSEMVC